MKLTVMGPKLHHGCRLSTVQYVAAVYRGRIHRPNNAGTSRRERREASRSSSDVAREVILN
jgi:hypothetical protein